MNTVELVLVILLSIGFLTLIILSIIVLTVALTIMRRLQRITERAELATSNVASLAESFSRKFAPVAASGLISLLLKRFVGKSGKSDKD